MGGGDYLPGFPHPNPTTSYWQLPPHRIAHLRTTPDLPIYNKFDYIIIGSGISGAAVAHKLLSRDANLSILMLEARTAASAASGRNGGNCRAGYWLKYRRYVKSLGEDEALKILKLEESNVADIASFVQEHNVDCDFEDVETADSYVTEDQFARALRALRHLEEAKARRPQDSPTFRNKVWRGQEARDHMGMPHVVGAITFQGHTQNPYLLVCKMLELSLEKGMNLQTNTTAMDVVPDVHGNGWYVKTDRGDVYGGQVVMATNAYTNALHRGIAATVFLTPRRAQVSALKIGQNMSADSAALMRGSAGINDVGSGDYYHYRRDDAHILYGGSRSHSKTGEYTTDDSKVNSDIAAHQHIAPRQVFGRQAWGQDGDVVRDWCGITCYTPDSCPMVGETPGQKGLWMSVGMNGHGMALAFRSAEALVEMMTTGQEPQWFPKTFRAARAWK